MRVDLIRGIVGESILFDGSGSHDSNGGIIVGYRWDWTNDGSWDTGWLTEPTATHAYPSAGSYTVNLEVIDNGDDCGEGPVTDTDTAAVTITLPQPKADFSYTPSRPTDLDDVQFKDTSSVSYDTIVSWQWSFGDGTSSTKQNPTHQFTDDGSYKVSLTVGAALGGTATITKDVTIANIPPVAIIIDMKPNPANEFETIFFNGSGEDLDGDVMGYWWNSSIDGPVSNLSSFTISGLSLGTHVISFRVRDDDGAWSNVTTQSLIITENNRPVNVQIQGPAEGKKGKENTYTIVGYDPDGDSIRYFVDWGDGSNSSWVGPYSSNASCKVSHIWNTESSFTIRACGRDEYGAVSDWVTMTVTMPYAYHPMQQFFEWLFQRFPNAFPILRQLLWY